MRTTVLGLLLALFAANLAIGAAPDAERQAAAAFAQQDWKTAARLYETLSQAHPTTSGLSHLGRAYIGLGRYADAKAALLQALTLTPGDAQSKFNMAIALDALGDEDGAFTYLQAVAAAGIMPQTLESHPLLAHMRQDPRFPGIVESADRKIHVCKYDGRYRAMDFWMGRWDGFMGPQKILRETVTSEVEGCMLNEAWEGTDGGHGRSENFFDPKTGQWEQVWVDAGGNVVKLSGGLTARGAMQMVGDNIDPDGKVHRFRQTWAPMKDGSVQRLFEQSDDEGKTWTTMLELQLRRPTDQAGT